MTSFSDIITRYFLVNVDDARTRDELTLNPAGTMRRLSVMLEDSVPLFTRPPSILENLDYTAPSFSDMEYLFQGTEPEENVTIQTSLVEFGICSIGKVGLDKYKNPFYAPVSSTYDDITGEVVITEMLEPGDTLALDFYTDGQFQCDFDNQVKRILGLCMTFVWETRFTGDPMNRTQKIQDKTFKMSSSDSAWTTAQLQRQREIYSQLNSEMLRYEQTMAYKAQMYGRLSVNGNPTF